jgi:signal transduction histidine kinase/CheY-like chemotaxis protein
MTGLNALTINALWGTLITAALTLRIHYNARLLTQKPTWLKWVVCTGYVAVFRCACAALLYSNTDPTFGHLVFATLVVGISVFSPLTLEAIASLLGQSRFPLRRLFWLTSIGTGVGIALFGLQTAGMRQPLGVDSVYVDVRLAPWAGVLGLITFFMLAALVIMVARASRTGSHRSIIYPLVAGAIIEFMILVHDLQVALGDTNRPYLALMGMVIMTIALTFVAETRLRDQFSKRQKETLEAEAQADTRTSFLAHMSHELRTPLTEILGLQHLLSRHLDDPKLMEHGAALGTSAHMLQSLIDDILDFEQIDAGRLQLDEVTFSPIQLMSEVEEVVASLPHSTELTVECNSELPSDLFLRGDANRIRQILLNLATNALKFTERGHVTLSAEGIDHGLEGVMLRYTVRDTGIGVPRDQLETIFNTFVQSEGGKTRRFGGTGIGLAICKQLTALMEGTLTVESAQGQGSCFTFSVVLARPARHETQLPTVSASVESAPDFRLEGVKVLLVEDTPINQMVARMMLEEEGCQVTAVDTAPEALERIGRELFHLVFMDLQMIPIGGIEATKKLRRAEDYGRTAHAGRIPVIALTAEVTVEAREAAAAAGMNDFVSKPFRKEQLVEVLMAQRAHLPDRAQSTNVPSDAETVSLRDLVDAVDGDLEVASKRLASFLEESLTLLHGLDFACKAEDQRTLSMRCGSLRKAAEHLRFSHLAGLVSELAEAPAEHRKALLEAIWGQYRRIEETARAFQDTLESCAFPPGRTAELGGKNPES